MWTFAFIDANGQEQTVKASDERVATREAQKFIVRQGGHYRAAAEVAVRVVAYPDGSEEEPRGRVQ